ncbi:hypothetical protein HY624_03565 [Candidatus Uhrbacteria bacterium]|nr:hypothetical protein [Candidatus Uhrbacteria bacterium]
MAKGDCEKCGGFGRCRLCKDNDVGRMKDGSDCECTYIETGAISQCIYCGGTGDSTCRPDPQWVRSQLVAQGRHRAAAGIEDTVPGPVARKDRGPLPNPAGVDWDAALGNIDVNGK